MKNCEPCGFKIKVADAKSAAEFALETILRRRELILADEIKKVTKRWFFRDRTTEEAKAHLLKYADSWGEDWQIKGWGTEDWAKDMLTAISAVDDEHIWVTSENATTIGKWRKPQAYGTIIKY